VTEYQPQLQRIPDARKAPVPLIPVFLLLYIFLAFGGLAGGIAALYNAVALRRPWLIFAGLVAAASAFVLSFAAIYTMAVTGMSGRALGLPLQLSYLGFGGLLGWQQWAHVRGHDHLDGQTVPVLQGFLGLFALQWFLSPQVFLYLFSPARMLLGG
jgi:hypothetical protein